MVLRTEYFPPYYLGSEAILFISGRLDSHTFLLLTIITPSRKWSQLQFSTKTVVTFAATRSNCYAYLKIKIISRTTNIVHKIMQNMQAAHYIYIYNYNIIYIEI